MVPCVRFRPFVRFAFRLSSYGSATLGTGGWLNLTRQGLAPCKKRQACLGAHVGPLTGITRNGQTIAYTYDRFGRVLEDSALTYGYDKNGNRSSITYPGGVSALYTHDLADHESTLSYDTGSGPQPLVTNSGYKPLGPLSTLTFANGLSETRLFDARYFPDRIQTGALLDWDYTEDAVGNPTQITGTITGQPYTATFAYQAPQYFLTQGNGPWGTRSWAYDRIGNRLTHQEAGEPYREQTRPTEFSTGL